MDRKPTLFVVSTGVSGNLGDAVIRRRVLRWVEGLGERHVYVGNTTEGWLQQLQLADDDTVYRAGQRKTWLKALLFGRGPRALVYDPGEVPLGKEHLKSELVFLFIGLWLRLRGGYVVRPPRAVAHYHWATGMLHRWGCRISQVVLWRDRPTLDRMRCGKLVPDTAFGEPAGPTSEKPRELLVISMRGKRPAPTAPWLEAVGTFAQKHGLRIVALSQVDEDEQRSVEIAGELASYGAELVPWGDGDDLSRETQLRAIYAETAIVVSDRLHVLLLAAQAGAMPVEAVERPVPKVGSHFATAGIDDISVDVEGMSAADIARWLGDRLARREDVVQHVTVARQRLETEVASLRGAISDLG